MRTPAPPAIYSNDDDKESYLVLLGLNNTKVEQKHLAAAAWIAGGRPCEWAGATGASPSP
jgi:hypothetical protein